MVEVPMQEIVLVTVQKAEHKLLGMHLEKVAMVLIIMHMEQVGGGGGFYGGYGGVGAGNGSDNQAGGGGSGYVNTNKLTSAQTKAGNTSFPSPTSSGNETGHSGNGYARITPVT